ncbi:MAG: twin-arginine translocation signal domain-containing protein, partial [Pseudomonadota bacterium]
MISRRSLITGMGVAAAAAATTPALAHHTAKYKNFQVARKYMPQTVRFTGYNPGTIVVDPRNHFLYLVES